MKKLIVLTSLLFFALVLHAQKSNGKSKPKKETGQSAPAKVKKNDSGIWEGTKDSDGGGPKPSKNQPAKVREAFRRDYPNAKNVSWSKYRGDWTATFGNGLITSTAVYHANGHRKDTRTVIQPKSLPSVILEEILKKRPKIILGGAVKIEIPAAVNDIFRVKIVSGQVEEFVHYSAEGKEVKYDY